MAVTKKSLLGKSSSKSSKSTTTKSPKAPANSNVSSQKLQTAVRTLAKATLGTTMTRW